MIDTPDTSPLDELLDEWLAGGEAQLFGPPEDMEQADRLAWALRMVDARTAEVNEVVARRTDALRVWQRQQLDQLEARQAALEGLLEGWARAQHAADPRRKTWKLPSGMVPKLRPRRLRAELDGGGDVPGVESLTGPGTLPGAAIKTVKSVAVGVVKEHTEPGDVLTTVEPPEGYEAREAIIWCDFGGPELVRRIVPGVVLLVPIEGPAGQAFSIQRPKGGE